MAQDLNTLAIVGRLTKDAELRYTASGQALAQFAIAVNRSVKNGDKWEDVASFFDLTLWGKQAEGLNKYLTKGTQVAVTGSLEQQRWEKDGQKQSKVAIHVESIQLIGGKRDGVASSQEAPMSEGGYSDTEDIPF